MTSFGAKCPHCDALFKVYPDQLRLHNGYANCGSCGLAFDVQAALLSLPPHQSQFFEACPNLVEGLPLLNAAVLVAFEPLSLFTDPSIDSHSDNPNHHTDSGVHG